MRLFYAASGPANLIASHEAWSAGMQNPTEVSVTFSSQVQQFCRDVHARAMLVSTHPDGARKESRSFTIEHRPKRQRSGLRHHVEEVRYGIGLLNSARRFGANVALLDSGTTHYFIMSLFRLFGIQVIPVLHNTLWPAGFRPTRRRDRLIHWLDAKFFRNFPLATIAVSPETERQVEELAPGHGRPVYQIRAQFERSYFAAIPPPPPHDARPFQVMFIGRVDREKGVLDIPHMARRVEDRSPGLVRWVICGRGPHADELSRAVTQLGVAHLVELRGWVSSEELRDVYASSHAAIVPTRSGFREGLAMTAAEAILAGRPLISNPVIPALELLEPAAMAARTDDPDSHADAVTLLAHDATLYRQLCAACSSLGEPFLSREYGLTLALHHILSSRGLT